MQDELLDLLIRLEGEMLRRAATFANQESTASELMQANRQNPENHVSSNVSQLLTVQ